ncbi:efflux RND transporter periplasmic adaptor subunit [Dyadobacter sp. LHD-138]|uniref:efflux RND transporter periplasmic adaptor subunit n=1 Tax=Dyadobacter sp. LHD-138 TaxID=3071413 RepID=UPI0027E16C72|nr:efflux RND transporter periplasmic adaptor subunit [Dyadobacter sp. LHD-138]MDQ6481903.1 efflux RND transporter periplasmic adaptor subunit [Dyadobacter sp. LHD-138]
MKRNRFISQPILSILLLSAVTGFLSGCAAKEEKKTKPSAVKVSVQEIRSQGLKEEFSFSGTIEADNSVQIGFAVPGTISAVKVNEGQQVSVGQVLATIDATEYDNALLIASAGLEQAEDMFNRLNGLYQKGSLPAKDFIDIKTKLAQAKANKNLAVKRVHDTKLYAPMSGIITVKSLEKGAMAAPGVPVFTIIKTDQVYARVTVPESEIGKISKGQTASVFISTLNQQLSGKITIINPQADPATKSYTVKVQLGNPAGRLLPGMIAQTKIATGESVEAITIPASAVIRDADDITYVFVAGSDQKAMRRRITAGGVQGNDIVVSEGLKFGDQVVIAGQTRLKDGAAISL